MEQIIENSSLICILADIGISVPAGTSITMLAIQGSGVTQQFYVGNKIHEQMHEKFVR